MRVHHEAEAEAEALEGHARGDDWDGGVGGLTLGDDRGNGAAEHDGECGEDPGGHHGLKSVGDGGE